MIDNHKSISVKVKKQGRQIGVEIQNDAVMKEVNVATLPVRIIETPPYEGDYNVKPTFSGAVLETKDKRMTDDLTVDPIYVGDVSNPQGGITIYIGGEFSG